MKKVIMMLLVLVFCIVAGIAKADCIFGEPLCLGPMVNSSGGNYAPCVSADGLELYFHHDEPDGEIRVARRATLDDEWRPSSNLGPTVNSTSYDGGPCISADGLSLYFFSERPGGRGNLDLWMTTRSAIDDNWGAPSNLGASVNSAYDDYSPSLSSDGLELYFTSERPGGRGNWDLWVTTRPTLDDDWGAPVNLGPSINTSAQENWPGISADGLVLFFSSNRSGGYGIGIGLFDIYVVRRKTTKDPWGPPTNLGPVVNSTAFDVGAKISGDGSMLYFHSPRPGGNGDADIWQIPISLIVDFNGDGKVDGFEFTRLLDYWGQDERSCDVSPIPMGNGIVDVQDLIVLSEYIGKDIDDPTLIAHWPLDEAQGNIAYNNASDRDGILVNSPVWQPDGGVVAGALQFDGIDDYVSTDFVLNPAEGVFSVVAWIKGSGLGQVVLSQIGKANWLMADAEGKLTTELQGFGRNAKPLLSEASITDGNWHRTGLVWDGSCRHLYVDGAEVAKDAEPLSMLEDAYSGFYFGTGSNLTPRTFFSGLIDDVRIYNRAVQP